VICFLLHLCILGSRLTAAIWISRDIKELHRQAAEELRVNAEAKAEMEQLLSELQQLLVGVSIMQDLTMRAKDSLVSFGERLSTRLFAAFLRKEVRSQNMLNETSSLHQARIEYNTRWNCSPCLSAAGPCLSAQCLGARMLQSTTTALDRPCSEKSSF